MASAADIAADVLEMAGTGGGGSSHDLNACRVAPDEMLASTVQGESLRGHEGVKLTG
jgi:hypothetical protein